MKILVALSGGIDSSTVAHMLKQEGHELVGVRFTLWTDPLAPAIAEILPSKCCNAQTAARAKKTADDLAIPYHIVDLENEFKESVVDPFLEGYKEGRTPNPCINCNRNVKFGRLLELCEELGCDKLATGHYARVAQEKLSDGTSRYVLLEAIDKSKDQSYYLYGLSQEQLGKVLFPLGGMQKSETYALAEHFGVPYEDDTYRESQDLCFFPEKTPTEFLKRHLSDALIPGDIVRKDGEVVGTHKGLPLYTIGQRRIGVGGLQIPLEVVSKNVKKNQLVVENQGSTVLNNIELSDVRFVSWMPPEDEEVAFECRTRSLAGKKTGTLKRHGSNATFRFNEPETVLASGQSLVFYRGEEVVGGGVMEEHTSRS